MPRFGDYYFFFDASGAPAVGRRPEGFEREYHARFDFAGMFKGYQAADDGLLPDGQADAMTILQRESGFFVGETELLRLRPYSRNLGCGAARADEFDRGVEIFTAALVGIVHGV